ncbi:hypothetical protein N7495_001168 [Penicillium taxi]|uniref:uncharacterized protein n=1 Tax=Penicillium taxi TaxID=168475 RepID=UPI0025451047|nr:uncharacterized protein N7495_001168 [Penicillium taxi]KAJ5908486.1 hypothetical protein N7495_001168 [Penicillium taxi]
MNPKPRRLLDFCIADYKQFLDHTAPGLGLNMIIKLLSFHLGLYLNGPMALGWRRSSLCNTVRDMLWRPSRHTIRTNFDSDDSCAWTTARPGLRHIISGTTIRSVRIPNHFAGPIDSEKEFNTYLRSASWAANLASDSAYTEALDLATSIENIPHRVLFTHGDLKSHNILVKGGRITGFIDWESAGWCPEYWDFTTAMRFTPVNSWRYYFVFGLGGDQYLEELKCERALTKLTIDSYSW